MSFIKNGSQDIGLLILRVGIGLMMIFPHGWGKMMGFSKNLDSFPDPLGIGSMMSFGGALFSEIICSLMLILGIKTRFFATPLLFTMLIAALVVHSNDPWMVKEKAALYGLVYLVLIISGGGKYSVRD